MTSSSRRTDQDETGEKRSRKRANIDVSSISSTRHNPQATDRNVCEAIWQISTEAVGNKEQRHA